MVGIVCEKIINGLFVPTEGVEPSFRGYDSLVLPLNYVGKTDQQLAMILQQLTVKGKNVKLPSSCYRGVVYGSTGGS